MEKEPTKNLKYVVETVEKTTPPDGTTKGNWHRYVVAQGTSKIVGKKTGTLRDVTKHAEDFAENLNSRTGKNGSVYAPKRK